MPSEKRAGPEAEAVVDSPVKRVKNEPSPQHDPQSMSQPELSIESEPHPNVDSVICTLALPDPGVRVAQDYSNTHTADGSVQAYGKLAGRSWTYYVQQLTVVIGRTAVDRIDHVDIDMAPSKVVSRRHAVIQYDSDQRQWLVEVLGRNGVRVDKIFRKAGTTVLLRSGNVLEVGGVQMMFVLPDQPPRVSPLLLQSRARAEARDRAKTTATNSNETSQGTVPTVTDTAATASVPAQSNDEGRYPRGVAIVSRPQVAGSNWNYFEQDLSSDECKDIKPPFSYATMISQAILSTPENMMSLADIYQWISSHYSFYRHSKPGWQNSIRHNLSLNKAFEKVARRENEPGKGSKWQIAAEYKEEFMLKASTGRAIKGRSPSRRSPSRQVPPPPQPQSERQSAHNVQASTTQQLQPELLQGLQPPMRDSQGALIPGPPSGTARGAATGATQGASQAPQIPFGPLILSAPPGSYPENTMFFTADGQMRPFVLPQSFGVPSSNNESPEVPGPSKLASDTNQLQVKVEATIATEDQVKTTPSKPQQSNDDDDAPTEPKPEEGKGEVRTPRMSVPRLPPPSASVTASSPAIWRYMHLSSTPAGTPHGANISTIANTTSLEKSSPPNASKEDATPRIEEATTKPPSEGQTTS